MMHSRWVGSFILSGIVSVCVTGGGKAELLDLGVIGAGGGTGSLEVNMVDKEDAKYLFERIGTNNQLTDEKKEYFARLLKQFDGGDIQKKEIVVNEDILATFLGGDGVFGGGIPVEGQSSVVKEGETMTYCSKTAKINLRSMTCLGTNSVFSKDSIVQGDAITLIEQGEGEGSLIAMPLDEGTIRKYLSTIHEKDGGVVFDMYIYRAGFEEKEEGDHWRKGHRAVAFVGEDGEIYVLDPYMGDERPMTIGTYKGAWGTESPVILFPQFGYAHNACAIVTEELSEENSEEDSEEESEDVSEDVSEEDSEHNAEVGVKEEQSISEEEPEEGVTEEQGDERKSEEYGLAMIEEQKLEEQDNEEDIPEETSHTDESEGVGGEDTVGENQE